MAKTTLRLLDQAHIAKPCPANWDEMSGDDRSRHCSMCRLNVYNLSDMTDTEAEQLLQNRTGRLCVRYFLRPDGKVMTKDCPRGLRAFRQRMAKQYVLAASLVLTALGCAENDKVKKAFGIDKFEREQPVLMGALPATSSPPAPTMGRVAPATATMPLPPTAPSIRMGEIAMPSVKSKENCEPGSK